VFSTVVHSALQGSHTWKVLDFFYNFQDLERSCNLKLTNIFVYRTPFINECAKYSVLMQTELILFVCVSKHCCARTEFWKKLLVVL